jgi:hypothetical protein
MSEQATTHHNGKVKQCSTSTLKTSTFLSVAKQNLHAGVYVALSSTYRATLLLQVKDGNTLLFFLMLIHSSDLHRGVLHTPERNCTLHVF